MNELPHFHLAFFFFGLFLAMVAGIKKFPWYGAIPLFLFNAFLGAGMQKIFDCLQKIVDSKSL